jgi:hypothetical protein
MRIIDLLDAERREIQQRIHLRAALHHAAEKGISISPISTVKVMDIYTGKHRPMTQAEVEDLARHDVVKDAYRYVEIQDAQWKALGLYDTGKHQQPPF